VKNSEESPTWLELQRTIRLTEASHLTSLSVDTIRRRYRRFIVPLSDRRDGMKLKDALAIADGTTDRA